MEFKFNVSEIFPLSIVEVNQSLIPPGFAGDRRGLSNVVAKVAEIVNAMGDASATAQGLTYPITTAERLRKADQTIYLLLDREAKGGKGVVTGMLKTGKKSLYVFDRDGQHHHISPPCVLDFYVHESRQRMGLGKQLFEHMLKKESVEPVKLAIDRPSEKLLSFMHKHYGLEAPLRQMNNYVVFDGFFPESTTPNINGDSEENGASGQNKQPANGLQTFTTPLGRYGAPRPPCSMGQIIHNQSSIQSNETTGVTNCTQLQTTNVTQSTPILSTEQQQSDIRKSLEESLSQSPKLERPRSLTIQRSDESDNIEQQIVKNIENEVHFDDSIEIEKTEFDNVNNFEELAIANHVTPLHQADIPSLGSDDSDPKSKSPNSLTAQGFFDLKFYHSRLW